MSKDKINRNYNLIFLTQYYSANNIKRQSEIDYCIEKNVLNTFIDKIILFCEGNFSNTIKNTDYWIILCVFNFYVRAFN